MKTKLTSPANPTNQPQLPIFPALYRDKNSGEIVLATSERGGVTVIGTGAHAPGYLYTNHGIMWNLCTSWARVDYPVVIEFWP